MLRPSILNPSPALGSVLLGGMAATLLTISLLFLAPVAGLPFIDVPRLNGGIFTGHSAGAFWIGFWLFFAGGVLVLPTVLKLLWATLPGPGLGFFGAAVKGTLWGLVAWLLSGLLLPLAGLVSQLDDSVVQNPGPFGFSLGILGAVELLVVHLLYGLALALVAAMGQGLVVLDTFGWPGYWPHKGKEELIS